MCICNNQCDLFRYNRYNSKQVDTIGSCLNSESVFVAEGSSAGDGVTTQEALCPASAHNLTHLLS